MNKIAVCLLIAVASACSAEPGEVVESQTQNAECWNDTVVTVRNSQVAIVNGGTGSYSELEVNALSGAYMFFLKNSEGKSLSATVQPGQRLTLNGEDAGCGEPQPGCAPNPCPSWWGHAYPVQADANSAADVRIRTKTNCQ